MLLCGSDWTNLELLQRVVDGLTPRTILLHGDNGLDSEGNALWVGQMNWRYRAQTSWRGGWLANVDST